MALTQLQSDILRVLAKNRSETSYLAGGLMLNKNWQRRSGDIGIFHDSDEEVTATANADLATLDAAGYKPTETSSSTGALMQRSLTGPPQRSSSGLRRQSGASSHL
jgi:hypothetical protein